MASELEKAVNALVQKSPGWKAFLPDRQPASAIPAQRGVGRAAIAQAGAGGSAGSRVELNYASREYWPERLSVSSDGMFSWSWKPIKTVVFVAGSDSYAEPTA